MITDHPYLFTVIFGLVAFGCGVHRGMKFREIQVRRLQQANQTLRIMLNGVPFDDQPRQISKGAMAAEERARTWQLGRAARKLKEACWDYSPAARRGK